MTAPSAARVASVTAPRGVGRATARALARVWGTPLAALVAGVALLLVAAGLQRSRADPGSWVAELWFWLGLMGILSSAAVVLVGRSASRTERLATVVALALLLYVVKLLHDPLAFTYADEAPHAFEAERIRDTGALFLPNPVIPVISRFPGLEGATAGIAALTGLSIFASGALLVAAARTVLALALFHLFERVGGSSWLAGVAVLVYMANPNFLFWSAQFSYESLGLPLVALSLFAVTARMYASGDARSRARELAGWTLALLLLFSAVAMTDHVSAFVLSGALLAICLIAVAARPTRRLAPWLPAVLAAGVTLGWLFAVAPQAVEYLSPVLGRAFHQTIATLTGDLPGRMPFAGGSTPTAEAPLWQRAIAIASVLITVVAIGFGSRAVRRRLRHSPLAVTFALAGLVYVAVLPMRLIPAAWETSNRASEFLFMGVAFLAALAAGLLLARRRAAGPVVLAVCLLAIGAVAAGWPPRVLLAHPYRIPVDGGWVQSQSHALSDLAPGLTPPGSRFLAPEGDGRVLLVKTGRTVFVSSAPFGAQEVLFGPRLTSGIVATLEQRRIRYVVVDRRTQGDDSMQGFFFAAPAGPLIDQHAAAKYDGYPGVDRILDTGDIALYDVGRLWGAPR